MGIKKQRTFIVKKWLDDSLNIEKKDKAYKGKRLNVDVFGALPHKDGIWRLAARLKGEGITQFAQGGSTIQMGRMVSKLNNKLARRKAR